MGFDAGALELDADAVEEYLEDSYDGDDYEDYDFHGYLPVPSNPRRECSHASCRGACGGGKARLRNAFEAPAGSDDEDDDLIPSPSVRMLEKSIDVMVEQDPWKRWTSEGPCPALIKGESLAEMIARERKELDNKLKLDSRPKQLTLKVATHGDAQCSPPGISPQAEGVARSMGPSESMVKRCESKPQAKILNDVGMQTDIHLEHQIKAITWIPVVETMEPVHDIDDDFYE